jgi:SAM-dependent methyltransferase
MERYSDVIELRLTGRHKKCIEICNEVVGKKILNIGCYNGWFEKVALEKGCKEVTGIDINDELLGLSRKNVDGARFLKAAVFSLPFTNCYFDLITMFDVIEHVPKDREKEALNELRRVLKDGGRLILSTPKANFLSNLLDPAWYFGHRHYSQSNITLLLKDAGFDIEKVESAGGFYELFSMILLYFFKWSLGREIPFKKWFDEKRAREYSGENGFATLFIKSIK